MDGCRAIEAGSHAREASTTSMEAPGARMAARYAALVTSGGANVNVNVT